MIVLVQQCRYLLEKLIQWQVEDFKKHGGVRERMHDARTAARAEEWDKGLFSMLDMAKSPEELEERLLLAIDGARRAAAAIARRKGSKESRGLEGCRVPSAAIPLIPSIP